MFTENRVNNNHKNPDEVTGVNIIFISILQSRPVLSSSPMGLVLSVHFPSIKNIFYFDKNLNGFQGKVNIFE